MSENNDQWVTKAEIASLIGKSEKTVERFLNANPTLKALGEKRGRSWVYPLAKVLKYAGDFSPPVSPGEAIAPTTNATIVTDADGIQEDSASSRKELECEIERLNKLVERRNEFLEWVLWGNFFDGPEVEGSFLWYVNAPNEKMRLSFRGELNDIGVDVDSIVKKHFINKFLPEVQAVIAKMNRSLNGDIRADFQELSKLMKIKLKVMTQEIELLQARLKVVHRVERDGLRGIDDMEHDDLLNILRSMGLNVDRIVERFLRHNTSNYDNSKYHF